MARATLGLVAAVAVACGLVACSQVLGVEDIPKQSPDAGVDATTDATADGTVPPDSGKHDAHGDATDGGTDADDGATPCTPDASRCAPSGVAVQTCAADAGWVTTQSCGSETPVCIGATCSCVPGATRCEGQQPQSCEARDAGPPGWVDAGAACPGTCTSTGCGGVPPSCAGDVTSSDAGADAGTFDGVGKCPSYDGGTESCCTSNTVAGGTFERSYDGVTPYDTPGAAATVSTFRLDRFEVTVGRFRKFVATIGADAAAWKPAPGSGKHEHLNGGQGLVDVGADAGATFEPGWDPAWDGDLTSLASSANSLLACGSGADQVYTWTPTPSHESLPINCVTWVEAYAFCIWDGGFLPSEAEWNYAAAGGAEQRAYPWSSQLPSSGVPDASATCANANFLAGTGFCTAVPGPDHVGSQTGSGAGDSKWLQADMAGNVLEWTLDVSAYHSAYPVPCVDCATTSAPVTDAGAFTRAQRGGSYLSQASSIRASARGDNPQSQGNVAGGFRCARTP